MLGSILVTETTPPRPLEIIGVLGGSVSIIMLVMKTLITGLELTLCPRRRKSDDSTAAVTSSPNGEARVATNI